MNQKSIINHINSSSSIFNVSDKVKFDESVTKLEYHSHTPYASQTYNYNDEIRISVNQQDIYMLPSKSFLLIEGNIDVKKADDTKTDYSLINNGVAHLFDEIRYELGGVEVDRTRNVGITTTMKNLLSQSALNEKVMENAGWKLQGWKNLEKFSFCIPLEMWLGIMEDYKKVILNVRQELVLLRSSSDKNSIQSTTAGKVKIDITKIQWCVPYIHVSDSIRIDLLNLSHNDKGIVIPFRSWQLHEFPSLPEATTQQWTVKTASQMEKPRFIILGFQRDKKNSIAENMSNFDFCKLNNIRLYLNAQYFPYDSIMGNKHLLYHMFSDFQHSYYPHRQHDSYTSIDYDTFDKYTPLIVIDCSRQNELLKSGAIDVKLTFDSTENFKPKTTAYCLILYDNIYEYTPLSGMVRKVM